MSAGGADGSDAAWHSTASTDASSQWHAPGQSSHSDKHARSYRRDRNDRSYDRRKESRYYDRKRAARYRSRSPSGGGRRSRTSSRDRSRSYSHNRRHRPRSSSNSSKNSDRDYDKNKKTKKIDTKHTKSDKRRYKYDKSRYSKSLSRSRSKERNKNHSKKHTRSPSIESNKLDKYSDDSQNSDDDIDGVALDDANWQNDDNVITYSSNYNEYRQHLPVLPAAPPFKNDGSFLEMFKKMQETQKKEQETEQKVLAESKKPGLPLIGKRRGGRVLKTGVVMKPKAIDEQLVEDAPKDAWSIYMKEVKKYREAKCDEEVKTRPLVK